MEKMDPELGYWISYERKSITVNYDYHLVINDKEIIVNLKDTKTVEVLETWDSFYSNMYVGGHTEEGYTTFIHIQVSLYGDLKYSNLRIELDGEEVEFEIKNKKYKEYQLEWFPAVQYPIQKIIINNLSKFKYDINSCMSSLKFIIGNEEYNVKYIQKDVSIEENFVFETKEIFIIEFFKINS